MTIRDFDNETKARLRRRVARRGRSTNEEALSNLCVALKAEPLTGRSLVEEIRARVEPFGGIDLELPPREPGGEPHDFNR